MAAHLAMTTNNVKPSHANAALHPEEENFDVFLQEELAHIGGGRSKRLGQAETDRSKAESPWSGIGLSGGGIRSACLALGVMQVLAEANLLKRFDYISTVSGGGYLGSSLQWWWARQTRNEKAADQISFGVTADDFPYGPSSRIAISNEQASTLRQGIKNLDFLRAHASYLTPGNELTIWSMIVVVLRTVAISLLIWLPLLVALFVGWHILDKLYFIGWAKQLGAVSPFGTRLPAYWDADAMRTCEGKFICQFYLRAGYAAFLYLFLLAVGFFAFVAVVYGFLSRTPQSRRSSKFFAFSAAGSIVTIVAGLAWLAKDTASLDDSAAAVLIVIMLLAGVVIVWVLAEILTPPSLNPSYWLRRLIEKWLGRLFIPSFVFLAIGLVPVANYYLGTSQPDELSSPTGSFAGVFSLLSGVASALYSYYAFVRNIVPGWASRIGATVGSLIYLYGTFVLAYWLSIVLVEQPSFLYGSDYAVRLVAACLVLLAFILSIYGNINFVGLHRYYRDRLMEAFMPSDASVDIMRTRRTSVADGLSVTDLASASLADPKDADFFPKPYPLINTNVILVKDDNPKFAGRGGANFLISPLFVGSSATGWQKTETYVGQNGPMTLPTAMAASGAAASASAGYIGTGVTMNPIVAAVMSLLNIRLGLWVANPAYSAELPFMRIPTFMNPGLWAGVLGRGHRRTNRFVELTDGGHFENLAMYELVRRKLGIILVVDGEADPTIGLSSLVSARNRIEQDFNAKLEFFEDQGPELLVMHPKKGYPLNANYAASPFIVGKLTYDDGTEGAFIYIKSNVTEDLDFSITGYLASNPDFPHQSTTDQFFSPDQFEAYRRLGASSAQKMINCLGLCTTIFDPAAILNAYRTDGPKVSHAVPD